MQMTSGVKVVLEKQSIIEMPSAWVSKQNEKKNMENI